MTEFEYGPVDLCAIGFEGERLDRATVDAIAELVQSGDIRLLDALVATRETSGDLAEAEDGEEA